MNTTFMLNPIELNRAKLDADAVNKQLAANNGKMSTTNGQSNPTTTKEATPV